MFHIFQEVKMYNLDDEPIVMTVDRPFLFEIVEESSGMVLFTGIINNIESK